jgi:hypothetical protein
MFNPAIVNIVTFFYPVGNTPAVCLTQDLPCEEQADILLLGCGDVRNLLFTAYSDRDYGTLTCCSPFPSNSPLMMTDLRRLDITCCDMELS